MNIKGKPGSKERLLEMFKGVNKLSVNEEFGYEEYSGKIGDRYKDSEGNEFTVSDTVKGGVTLRGQGGSKEVATNDLKSMEKLNESFIEHKPESDPYGGARQKYQDGPGYGDEKPVNSKLRVNSVMLDKFIAESTDQDKYEDVVFMQGEEASEPLNILMNQGQDEALKYLQQWHNPGEHMGSDRLGHGDSDQTYEKDGYVMSWNPYIGYIGLQYEITPQEINEIGIEDGPTSGRIMSPHESDLMMQAVNNLLDRGEPVTHETIQAEFSKIVQMNENEEEISPEAEVGDQIEGGLADDESVSDSGYDPQQVLKGIEIEMEHTDDPKIALEIAMDHIKEIPDYYTRLDKMEKEAGVEDAESIPMPTEEPPVIDTEGMPDELMGHVDVLQNPDEEMENKLLGFDTNTPNTLQERYNELDSMGFDSLSEEEKEEYYQLWQEFGG